MPRPPVRAKDRFLVFGAPSIQDAEVNEVVSTLRGGWLGTSPRVARFENEFSAYQAQDAAPQSARALPPCTSAW